jgi:hypothetical protein
VIFDARWRQSMRRQFDLRANRIGVHATMDEKIAGRA